MARKRTKIQVSCEKLAELRKRVRMASNLRDKERLQVVFWATRGQHTLDELAQLACRARSTIQVWLDNFEAGGITGLLERDTPPGLTSPFGAAVLQTELLRHEPPRTAETHPNTPANTLEFGSDMDTTCPEQSTERRKLPLAAKALIEILHHNPKIYGINRTNWTLESLADVFKKRFGQKPSISTVGRLLKQAGLRWKKSRQFLTSSDPNYKEKVELLLKTLQSLKADEDLFFIDELGPLAVRRHGGRSYTPKGETPTHPQNQRAKGSIALYGALSAKTNQVVWFYGKAKDSAGMIELVEILYNQHHDKTKIYLTWDAASWHRSDELVQWTDVFNTWNSASGTGPQIAFIPLPSNSQFLDVIEAVFSGMKRAVISPKQVPIYQALTAASKTKALYHKQAIDLIKLYENLDSIFKNMANVASERIRQKLQENEGLIRDRFLKNTVKAAQNLCCENLQIPSPANLNTEFNRQFLREYGFYSLVRLLDNQPDEPF